MLLSATTRAATYSLIVSGLGGEPEYEKRFVEQADKLAVAARQLTGSETGTIVLSGAKADRESVRRALRDIAAKAGTDDQVIVTLIGHGSFDGDLYRLNLPGPDLTAAELAALFDAIPARQQLIVNATSASGAVIEQWQRDRRIVITATKGGGEKTATRFAEYWSVALTTLEADTNKDDVITVTEAYDYATRKVAESFKAEALLATEHARIAGAEPARFQVARLGTAARVTTDPAVNAMYAERVRIEREFDGVRERKAALDADNYYDELEGVLVKLALLQRQIDAAQPPAGVQP
ncbi:C13 family peptidase [Povalibacter sp.]|uniref:C13 family peptidase n=1 Tax=Povalibacter sp. TaxID=1962978 RepID=UPI002F420D5A